MAGLRSVDLSPSLKHEFDSLILMANDYRVTKSIWIASLAVFVYDYGLTFGQEITFLRGSRTVWARLLFITMRYWSLLNMVFDIASLTVVQPPKEFCAFFFRWFCYGMIPVHGAIGVILILRLYAMFNGKKSILYTLLALLGGQIIAEIVAVRYTVVHEEPLTLPRSFSGCVPTNQSKHLSVYLIPMLIFQSTVCLLAVIKSVQMAAAQYSTPKVMVVLLRDSAAYFGSILSVLIVNIVIFSAARPSLVAVALGPLAAADSILGCRMLLNVYQAVQPTYGLQESIFETVVARPDTERLGHSTTDLEARSTSTFASSHRDGAGA